MAKRSKTVDVVEDYRQKADALQEAQGEEEQAAALLALEKAKKALEGKVVSVLGGFLRANSDNHLEELAGGGVTLSEALKGNKMRADIDPSPTGMAAADQLSLIAEIEEADPEFSKRLVRTIFTPKLQALLKNPVKVDSRDAAAFTSTALTLASGGTKQLVQYIARKGVNEAHALNALVTLAEQDPLAARNVTEQLPQEVQTGLLVGRLSINDVRAIGLMGPETLADQVRAQYANDSEPSGGYTDRDNMTAASLLAEVLNEKSVLGKEQLYEALIILKMLGSDQLNAILKFNYAAPRKGRQSGDAEAAAAAKDAIRQFWREHKSEMAQAIRSYRERRDSQQQAAHAAPAAPAPTVDILAGDLDLDDL